MVEASDIRVKILLQYMQRRKMSKTENELKYDENVKRFLAQKIILAHILVSYFCIAEDYRDEYRGCIRRGGHDFL